MSSVVLRLPGSFQKRTCSKQSKTKSDCSCRSSLICVHMFVCMPNVFPNVRIYMQQTTSADDIFRCMFVAGEDLYDHITVND